jgi:hypothetical protein
MDLESTSRLLAFGDYVAPFAIRVVTTLGVADRLAGGPQPVGALAAAVGADPPALARPRRPRPRIRVF